MKDLLAWFGLKRFPFDKSIKTQDALRYRTLERMRWPGSIISNEEAGILLLTGDPGVGKTLALQTLCGLPSMKTSSNPSIPHFPPSPAPICFIISIGSWA